MSGPLGLDDDTLNACVQCGLCLPHCPTWRATGEEVRSPRGRIDAMRAVELDGAPLDRGFAEAIGSCVGCRACETACPSAVRYGQLLEGTADALAQMPGPGRAPRWQRLGLSMLDRRRIVRAGVIAVAAAQRLGLAGRGHLANLPPLPVHQPRAASTGDDVVLLTGCVMDATERRVHAAAVSVLGSAGFGVRLQPAPGCCGALAAHAGLGDLAAAQLERLATSLPSGVPVISDAAGCGARILEAGRRAPVSSAARDLGARTLDISSFLVDNLDRLPRTPEVPAHPPVVVAQPCHLLHVQGERSAAAVLDLLAEYVPVLTTDDDDLCCGAGGSHSVLRPREAAAIRDAKIAALERAGADRGAVVVSANPGCSMHLRAGGMLVEHPVEVLERVLGDRART